MNREGAGAEHERLQIPGKEWWVGLWLQKRGWSADAWILAWNEPDPKPQQGLGVTQWGLR